MWALDGTISINGAQGAKVFVDDREIRLTGGATGLFAVFEIGGYKKD